MSLNHAQAEAVAHKEGPVSYTHLDVYKRQVSRHPDTDMDRESVKAMTSWS